MADLPLLGLVMIVRNEAKRIAEVLASYRSFVDRYTILDTGSTDGTQDLARGVLEGIPGDVLEEPFVDFATSRNRALELHGQATVFTFMPNGDVLEGGQELRTFLEQHRDDMAGAYRVRIAPGHYYHPLVMRAGRGWHYKWRTHECAVGALMGPAIPGVTVWRDRGNRTDAEWRVRWTRDLDLLHRDRVDDPSAPRPYFYLGQTHECLGQFAEALTFFERRTELGGYFDEIFEAKFRIGKMKQRLGRSWADVQQAYLDAYAHDPRRAEPLCAIAEHWHGKDQHALTRLFAVPAGEMSKPPTDLFLDEEVYQWKAADLAAISSFYAGHKEVGRAFAEKALRARPHDERLRANRGFFARDVKALFGAAVQAIEFQPDEGWNASNPSICWGEEGLRCIVRTVNYRIVRGAYLTPAGDGVICTRNFFLSLDADLKTTGAVELVDQTDLTRTAFPIHGFEDARLFQWEGTWWATATVCDLTLEGKREIALLQLDPKGAVVRASPLRGPWSDRAQKNWMPVVDEADVRFVYAVGAPSTMLDLQLEQGQPALRSFTHMDAASGRLRGGSQGVWTSEGWLFVVHDVVFHGSGRIYLHRFVLLNEAFALIAMSDLFYFERLGIEFCAGLARVEDRLIASYAVNDGSARLAVFSLQRVLGLLRTDLVV
jgi:tetratricopeptide (TPR) repeat protein